MQLNIYKNILMKKSALDDKKYYMNVLMQVNCHELAPKSL
jgi:hypothetical protein